MEKKKRRSIFSFLTCGEREGHPEVAPQVETVPPQQFTENAPLCKNLENQIIADNEAEDKVDDHEQNEDNVDNKDNVVESETSAGNIIVPEKRTEVSPLLANKPFVKLVEECAELMNEFEGYAARLESEEGRYMANLVVKRLQESLEHAGVERIENDQGFSILRHTPVPIILVEEGTPLKETIEPGLAIGNRIFRKAKVVIEK